MLFLLDLIVTMLTHRRKPVCLSLISTDLPVYSTIETSATIYQKDKQRFQMLLKEPAIIDFEPKLSTLVPEDRKTNNPRLLWLEVSPKRVVMTMQGNGELGYRHLWEKGVYGLSRYTLQNEVKQAKWQLRMRNYTRSLELKGYPFAKHLRLEYELWSEKLHMGCYILNLEIDG